MTSSDFVKSPEYLFGLQDEMDTVNLLQANGAFVIHHIDQNTDNNDASNLIPVCPNCHREIHAKRRKLSKIRKNASIVANGITNGPLELTCLQVHSLPPICRALATQLINLRDPNIVLVDPEKWVWSA